MDSTKWKSWQRCWSSLLSVLFKVSQLHIVILALVSSLLVTSFSVEREIGIVFRYCNVSEMQCYVKKTYLNHTAHVTNDQTDQFKVSDGNSFPSHYHKVIRVSKSSGDW